MVAVTAKSRTISNGTTNDATPVETNFVELYNNDATLATAVTALENSVNGTATLNGVKTFADGIKTDTIDEKTTDTGVTIEGVLIKDGGCQTLMPTGSMIDFLGSTTPAGWVLGAGKTIGSTSSGATERANDDTKALFTLLWNSMADGQAAVPGGRGANAAADWAANKTITLPDTRGRTTIALNNLGGSTATTVTSASLNGDKAVLLGGIGGEETHKLTVPEMPSHSHSANVWVNGSTYGDGNRFGNVSSTTGSTGGDGVHNNMQPWIATLKIIKL